MNFPQATIFSFEWTRGPQFDSHGDGCAQSPVRIVPGGGLVEELQAERNELVATAVRLQAEVMEAKARTMDLSVNLM